MDYSEFKNIHAQYNEVSEARLVFARRIESHPLIEWMFGLARIDASLVLTVEWGGVTMRAVPRLVKTGPRNGEWLCTEYVFRVAEGGYEAGSEVARFYLSLFGSLFKKVAPNGDLTGLVFDGKNPQAASLLYRAVITALMESDLLKASPLG